MFVEIVSTKGSGAIAEVREPGRNMIVSCGSPFTLLDVSGAIALNYVCHECGDSIKVLTRFKFLVPVADMLYNCVGAIGDTCDRVIFSSCAEGYLDFVWRCTSDSGCIMARRWIDNAMPRYARED